MSLTSRRWSACVGSREVGQQRGQIGPGLGGRGKFDPLVELCGVEASFGVVLAQHVGYLGPLSCRDPKIGPGVWSAGPHARTRPGAMSLLREPISPPRLNRNQCARLAMAPSGQLSRACPNRSSANAVEQLAREVETAHGVPVDVVAVGDCLLDGDLRAMLAAGREAMVNSAKWSGAPVVSLFTEVERKRVSMFVIVDRVSIPTPCRPTVRASPRRSGDGWTALAARSRSAPPWAKGARSSSPCRGEMAAHDGCPAAGVPGGRS